MKCIPFLLLALFVFQTGTGQDYFAVVVINERTTYRYPENSEITLIDSLGNTTVVHKNDVLTLNGDYTLSIQSPWREKPEILKSAGGTLELFVLPVEDRKNIPEEHRLAEKRVGTETFLDKPSLEKKKISISKKNPNHYTLLAVFTNGVVFKFEDGRAMAWQDDAEIEITNHYLVHTPEHLLKISFNEGNGAFWYTFEQ